MSELDKTYVGRQAKTMDTSPRFDGYSSVKLKVNDELAYYAGTNTGLELELSNPFGTQQMADDILAYIRGYEYQPASASGAQLDPSAELGDGITIGQAYTGIYVRKTRFGRRHTADVEAPTQKEIPHEYEYKSQSNREVNRKFANVQSQLRIQADEITAEVEERKADSSEIRATLSVQAGKIDAKVEQQGGNNSFGWSMTDTNMVWKANGSEIFRLDKNGAKVTGEIRATSGVIGGFTIGSNSLTYNNQSWGGSNTNGIYIGPNGIQLGRNFRVDNAGNLTAASGTFTGSVRAGNIQWGGDAGYFNGGGISGGSISGSKIGSNTISGGNIGYGTISTSNTSGGINSSLGYANFANSVFNGWDTAQTVYSNGFKLSGRWIGMASTTIDGQTIKYLRW